LLYSKISKLCKDRNISVARLEKECGLGNATVRGWKISNPNLSNLKKVADYFGVSIEYFLNEEKEAV
jgi:transcriptional regulator with XRE-family HTH domain